MYEIFESTKGKRIHFNYSSFNELYLCINRRIMNKKYIRNEYTIDITIFKKAKYLDIYYYYTNHQTIFAFSKDIINKFNINIKINKYNLAKEIRTIQNYINSSKSIYNTILKNIIIAVGENKCKILTFNLTLPTMNKLRSEGFILEETETGIIIKWNI